jgi:hypothetical protein
MNSPSSRYKLQRSRPSPWREVPLRLSMVLVTIAVIGTVAPPSVAQAASPKRTGTAHAQGQMPGVFTGEFVDGVPVYRFPTVIVAGSRNAEPVRSLARAAQPRAPKGTRAKGHA